MRTVLKRTFANYQKTLQQSLDPNLQFWRQSATQVKWAKPPTTILKTENNHFFKWYPDGKMNITENCLDRHLVDRSDQIAYYYESPLTNTRSTITYAELHKKVSEFAGSLQSNFGIKKGDAVVIYMPMVLESLIAILACARIGAPHVVVFGGFSAHELGNRIIDCNPKLLICANAGKQPNKTIDYLKIVNQALKYSKRQDLRKIILQRELLPKHTFITNEYDFNQVLKGGKYVSPTIMDSIDHLYYLYTSGTTGKPKGIMRDHGGTAVILHNAMKYVYDTKPNDGMFCTSDIGWVLGHSFIIYGPLLVGLRSVLFEGKPVGTPDAGVYWEILQRNNIQHLYTSPTAVRSIRKEDPHGKFIKQRNLSSLKTVTCVGERCDIPTFQWLLQQFPNQFVNDTYWQTESGSPILSNFCGFDQKFKPKAGSATKALPGYDVRVLDQKTGKQCAPNEPGIICIKQPLPPSFMLSILNNDQLYVDKYFKTFEGYYNTGDSGMIDQDCYFSIMSRVDDVINTAGHRLSTGQMEQAIMLHPKIAQAIVIGANDEIKGQVPVGFVTIKSGYECDPAAIEKEVVKLIRQEIGPVASFKTCHVVPRLPKTRSGKYLRHIMRKMYNKQKYEVPSTVEDIEVVHELEKDMARMLSNHK